MSDENKIPEQELPVSDAPAEEIAENAAEKTQDASVGSTSAAAEESAALNDELEQLRSTFQSELDKATAEAQAAEDMQPVIQELDDGPDPDEEEDDGSGETNDAETEDGKKAKKKKKKSGAKKPVGLIVALVLVCILIVAPLSAYFVLSIKEPNLNSYISAYAAAQSAKDAETKVTKYTEALSFCSEDSKVLSGERQKLNEKIVVATCESQGYAAAYSYMSSNLDETAQAKPKTKAFRQFLKIADQLEEVYAQAPEKLPQAIADAGSAEAVDYDALAGELKTPELVREETAENLKTLATAIEGAQNTADDQAFYDAMHDYLSCYQSIQSMGVTAQAIPEDILVKLWNNGYAYETSLTMQQFFTDEMQAAVTNEEVKNAIDELSALKAAKFDLDAFALQQTQAGKTAEADLTAAITANVSDSAKKAVTRLAKDLIEGQQAESEQNLTAAKRHYSVVIAAEDQLNMPTTETALRLANILLAAGDVDNAYMYVTNYLLDADDADDAEASAAETAPAAEETTAADSADQAAPAADGAQPAEEAAVDEAALSAEKLLTAHPEFRTNYDDIIALHEAQETVGEVVQEAYSAASYGGTVDTDAINASLDAITLENTSRYIPAYVNYFKFVLASNDETPDYDAMLTHLLAAQVGFGTHGIICQPIIASVYLAKGDTANAFAVAKMLAAIDTGDDFANSLLSREQRIAGDAAAAKTFAQAGIDAMGTASANYCEAEMVMCLMIDGNYADAYARMKELYAAQRSNGSLTVESAELMLATASLFKSADEAEQKEADDTATEINGLFTQNSLTVSENTKALMDGSKQPADVYLGEAVVAAAKAQ